MTVPPPKVLAMVVCDQVHEDPSTGKYTILGRTARVCFLMLIIGTVAGCKTSRSESTANQLFARASSAAAADELTSAPHRAASSDGRGRILRLEFCARAVGSKVSRATAKVSATRANQLSRVESIGTSLEFHTLGA